MYFKRLEIIGFKSFMNKTVLHFEPGITAVVGPNGTGKSNVFDAIRWVLGEQSAKSLRGCDMQDVIFNGTDLKEPLSMAEVSLCFDNSSRFFNLDHHEVEITRRIFRSGESEYLLNKTQVRLKDVLDILMGTGVSQESYSLIAQGQIDLILSSRPEDRRVVFDEASGITRYKAQKREAMRKLEETEQNLLRVNDIVTEVKRQIGSLERQAAKARRYKESFEELKSKETSLAIYLKIALLRQKDEVLRQLSGLGVKEAGLLEKIKEQELKISGRQGQLRGAEDAIMALKNELLNLDNQVARNNQNITFNQEKISELEAQKTYLESGIDNFKYKLLQDAEQLNQLRVEYSGLQKNIDEKSHVLSEREGQLNALVAAIKLSLENIANAKKEIMELVTHVANIHNEIADFCAKQQIYHARQKRLEIEKAKVKEEEYAITEELKIVTQEMEELNQVFSKSSGAMSALKEQLEKETLSLDKISADIENLQRQKLTLESHREFIEKLKTKLEDIDESLNAVVYLDKLPVERVSGLVIKIKEYAGLSDADAAILSPTQMKLLGEAKPIDLDTQKINDKIAKIEEELAALSNSKIAQEARIAQLNQEVLGLGDQLRQQEIALANKKSAYANVYAQLDKIKEEEEIIAMELSDVLIELASLETKVTEERIRQAQAENEHKNKESAIINEEDSINANSHLKEKVLIEITQIKTEVTALTKRIQSDEATLKMLEDSHQQDKSSLSNIEKQIQEAITKKDAAILEIKDFESAIAQIIEVLEGKKTQLQEAENLYAQMNIESGDVNSEIDASRKEMDEIKNNLYQLQMQDKDIDYRYAGIKERMLQNYKVDLEATQDTSPEQEQTILPQEKDESALMQEIAELKKKLDSLGTVNLVAIEEYDELKKRYDFLTQQQNDLDTAKDTLHEAILKINRTTKKMFMDTFELIRGEFRNYFRMLFNGGDAQIFLIDENDPLESGIEIICRPPGKKLQNVLLLSGGEKSMSAIALIFAIFKVKPSPFCVLDEIDAALDEANVDRFSHALLEFAKISQFIVITHNKKTIANADVMYGITMEQSGVSKIVSVKFAKDKSESKDNSENKDKVPEKDEGDLAVAEPV